VSGLCLWAHEVNDVLCKVGVEFAAIVLHTIGAAVGTVGSHDYVIFLWLGDEEGCCQNGEKWRAKSDDVKRKPSGEQKGGPYFKYEFVEWVGRGY